MESATGARRCKISVPFFCARRVQFWLHFEVRGGHWLDEGRLSVQKKHPKAIPKSERKIKIKFTPKGLLNDAKMGTEIDSFSTLTAKGVKARNYCIYNEKRGSRHPEINPKS